LNCLECRRAQTIFELFQVKAARFDCLAEGFPMAVAATIFRAAANAAVSGQVIADLPVLFYSAAVSRCAGNTTALHNVSS